MKSLLIAVDFDDTVVRNDRWPQVGQELPRALWALKALYEAGHRIQIWTCRHGEALALAKQWLDEREVPYERINENCPVLIEKWADTRKMAADIYIDDRNLRGLPHWGSIPSLVAEHVRQLEAREREKAWYKLPRIIGLSGKRGSGKNTVATLLQELMPNWWNEHAFASKVKYFGSQLAGSGYDFYSQAGKQEFMPEWGLTVGEFLQKLGTDGIRDGLHQNAWVLALFAGLEEDEHALITDCRFPNELDAIRERGGIVIRVEGDPLKQRGDGTRNDNHPSETALDGASFDYTLYNTGTLDELREQVSTLLAVLQERAQQPA